MGAGNVGEQLRPNVFGKSKADTKMPPGIRCVPVQEASRGDLALPASTSLCKLKDFWLPVAPYVSEVLGHDPSCSKPGAGSRVKEALRRPYPAPILSSLSLFLLSISISPSLCFHLPNFRNETCYP